MTTAVRARQHSDHERHARPVLHWWLWLSVPVSVLAIAGSLAGIFVDRIYASETGSWANEAVGQDIANLVVIPAMLVFAYAAARGSLRAFLAWLGTLVYTVYAYAIYSFAVHFGPLFLLYVAVLGMATWALVGALGSVDPARVRAAFTTSHLARFASGLLLAVAGLFALLWLSEDVPAMIRGTTPEALVDSGLPTNPVHVLDLSLFLPSAVLAGMLLRRGRAWGHVLAPVVLTAMAAIGAGIVSLIVVDVARGDDGSPVVAAVIGLLGLVQAGTAVRFLRGIDPHQDLRSVLRRR